MDRSKVEWNKIKTLNAENPNIVHFQYAYNGAVPQLDLLYRARKAQDLPNTDQIFLTQIRDEHPKISFQKFKDLVYLCNRNIIPRIHHCFYALLSHEDGN